MLNEPPPNPEGGKTLIVDQADPACYPRPSAALKDAGPDDQIFVHPGIYEDRLFGTQQPIHLIGAGRDHVQIFSRRSGPLYLQQIPSGRISGMTFRYVGSDQHSAINIFDSTCTITQCRATDGLLSGIVIYGPNCRPSLIENEVCRNRESGIFCFAGAQPYLAKNVCFDNHHFGWRSGMMELDRIFSRIPAIIICSAAYSCFMEPRQCSWKMSVTTTVTGDSS